jgi:hypothetical protein
MADTNLFEDYELKTGDTDNITLKVTIGYAQLGATTISVGGKRIKKTAKDEFNNDFLPDANGVYPKSFSVVIGTSGKLRNKQLVVISNVERIQDNEDRTSVDFLLTGGRSDSDNRTLTEKIAVKGEWLTYVAVISIN